MFMLDTEAALLDAFRPKDRKSVEISRDLKFPLFVRDYVAWVHPSGGHVYLVFAVPQGAPTGITFETTGGAGTTVPQMCDWCHSAGVGTVALLTAIVTAKKRAGVHVCADLSCREKLEDDANRAGRSVLPAMAKLVERMGRFASDVLGIDLSGARR